MAKSLYVNSAKDILKIKSKNGLLSYCGICANLAAFVQKGECAPRMIPHDSGVFSFFARGDSILKSTYGKMKSTIVYMNFYYLFFRKFIKHS